MCRICYNTRTITDSTTSKHNRYEQPSNGTRVDRLGPPINKAKALSDISTGADNVDTFGADYLVGGVVVVLLSIP
jgi:hypothetical protein